MSRLARWRYRRLLGRMAGPRLLRAFAEAHPQAFFVEIGANDGRQHDPLHPVLARHPWRGILVEPVPHVFARLEQTYAGNDRLTLVNAAVGHEDGRMPFFHLRAAAPGERVVPFHDALGSFSRELVLRHAREIPDVHERLVETEVPVLSFDTLLARHGGPPLDLVTVDTEGFDWEVVRSIDLARHRPRMVAYEHYHLSRADRDAAVAHLEAHGYETLAEHFDTYALRREDDGLTRRFRSLEPVLPAVLREDETGG